MPGGVEHVLRAVADLRAQHVGHAFERGDDGVERRVLAEAAHAIGVDLAVADEGDALRRGLVDLEFLGVAEMLVDAAAALGRDRDQHATGPSAASLLDRGDRLPAWRAT